MSFVYVGYVHYLKNKTSVPVFYRRITYWYEFGCEWIKARVRLHLNEYAYFILQ